MHLRKSHRNSGYVTDTNAHTRGAGAIAAMDGRSRKAAALGAIAERVARRRDQVKAQYALGKDNTPGFSNVAVTGGTYAPTIVGPKPPPGKPLLKVPFQGATVAVAAGTGGHLKVPLPPIPASVRTGGKAPVSSGGRGKSPFDVDGDRRTGTVLPGAVTTTTSPTTGVTTTTVTIPGTSTTVSSPTGGGKGSPSGSTASNGGGAGVSIEPEDFDEMPIISAPSAAPASSGIPNWAWYAAGGVGLWFLLRGE